MREEEEEVSDSGRDNFFPIDIYNKGHTQSFSFCSFFLTFFFFFSFFLFFFLFVWLCE